MQTSERKKKNLFTCSSSSLEWPQLKTTSLADNLQFKISAAVSIKSDKAGISVVEEFVSSEVSSFSSSMVENRLFLFDSWFPGEVSAVEFDSTKSPGLSTMAESCHEIWQAKWIHSAWGNWAKTADFVAFSPVKTFVEGVCKISAIFSASLVALGISDQPQCSIRRRKNRLV